MSECTHTGLLSCRYSPWSRMTSRNPSGASAHSCTKRFPGWRHGEGMVADRQRPDRGVGRSARSRARTSFRRTRRTLAAPPAPRVVVTGSPIPRAHKPCSPQCPGHQASPCGTCTRWPQRASLLDHPVLSSPGVGGEPVHELHHQHPARAAQHARHSHALRKPRA